jgi:hypothetical protein
VALPDLDSPPPRSYDRVNMLIRAAFIMAGALVIAVIAGDFFKLSSTTQTTLGVILGRVWGYIDAIFAFEFNTTRNSKQKDETINELTKAAAAPTPPTGGQVQIDADTALVVPSDSKKG